MWLGNNYIREPTNFNRIVCTTYTQNDKHESVINRCK